MLKMSYSEYLSKVHGGWLGKCIGGTIGTSMENNRELMNFTLDVVFPKEIPPNDDLDLQILWLKVLEDCGANITSRDLADAWLKYCWYPFNEYGYFVKNYRLGIAPPRSGTFNNDFFKNSMGCPIRSEIWGYICPGDPQVAAQYAYRDGILDHDMLAVYGEQFFAALEAQAFFETNIFALIQTGLEFVPSDSELAECILFVIDQYHCDVHWKEARRSLLNRFSSPDGSHSVQNVGLTVLALLFGRGDFTETMLIAVNSGYDTDCTAATSGAILGQMLGAEGIPKVWLEKMGPEYVMWFDVKRRSMLIKDLSEDTCAAGLSLVRDGLISVNITDIPKGIVPSLPKAKLNEIYSLDINYIGIPSIGYGENANVEIILHNTANHPVKGELVIHTSEALEASITYIQLIVGINATVKIPVCFSLSKQLQAIPQQNMVNVEWKSGDKLHAQRSFGFSGASRMKVIGPFWDVYDTRIHQENPYQNGRPSGRANFNNFVNIDRPYINESFININEQKGTYINFHTDKLALNEVYSHLGQSCLYLVHNVICPKERDAYAVIGHNDGYKFWLNGELKSEAREHTMWMPYNDEVQVRLRAGLNQFIFKVIRSDSNFEFSIGLRGDMPFIKEPNFTHWYIDLASLLESPTNESFV